MALPNRWKQWVPGAAARSLPRVWMLHAVFFYAYVLVLLLRAPRLMEMIRSGPSADRLGAVAIVVGAAGLYLASVLPLGERGGERSKIAVEVGGRFSRRGMAVVGLGLFLFFVCVSLLAPLVSLHLPYVQPAPSVDRYVGPSVAHPMGTDKFGRDVFSRVVYGGRTSLFVGMLAVVLASIFGMVYGAFSGYFGGWLDELGMRVVDGLLAFPRLLLVLTLLAFFSNSFALVVIFLAATGWMGVARLVRAEVLSLRERDFVHAAVATGVGHARVVWRHVIPNALGPVIVTATLRVGTVILLESYLSFLGLGVQAPTPSWGGMVFEGRDVLLSAWWVSACPGMAIVLAVVACNLVGDGLRDALDVKSG